MKFGYLGQIATELSGSITSGDIGAGAVASGQIASGSIGNVHIASGTVRSGHVGNAAVTSGSFASGAVDTYHFASGAIVMHAQEVVPFISGGIWTILTEETISGFRAVNISQSGTARIAMASVSGRMPAVGIAPEDTLSGLPVNLHVISFTQAGSGLVNFAASLGRRVYVGRSGHIVSVSGGFGSGGWLSGDFGQVMGTAVNSGALLVHVGDRAVSGGPPQPFF